MERIPFEIGRVVYSTQGRDEGRYFIVVEKADENHVLLCDGQTRKLDHPKKKKLIHIKAKPCKMEEYTQLKETNTLQDASIRRFLEANGFGL